jgi:hypothetical protein
MSATQSTGATVAINTAPKPNGFFSLARAIRDEIYDIIHLQELEAELIQLVQLVFRFYHPPFHIRLINRRFTAEFNMRTPAKDRAKLSVTLRSENSRWYTDEQPQCLPELPIRMQNARFTRLEFKFDVSDCYHEIYIQMLRFDDYLLWIGKLLEHDPRLASSDCGGELRLQLSFKYVSNLQRLVDLISQLGWYDDHCTKITMVLLGVHKRTPTIEKLGLDIYSDISQSLAVWDKFSGWKLEKVVYKHARIENLSNLDPFDPSSVRVDAEIDWVAFEDGDYFAMEGSGWDMDKSAVEKSRAEWNSGGEGPFVDGGVQEDSVWEVDDSAIEPSGSR